ncbi:MAG: hypothetical protein ACYDEX_09150 [Mobilitalea sp.]
MKLNKKVSEVINSVENIENGYNDITELSMNCKFSNCTHMTESDCAVKKAITEGILSLERFNHYYRDKNEAEYVTEQKNKTKAIDYMNKKKMFDIS